jgi:hypothetical protein
MNSARFRMVIENVSCQHSISHNVGHPYNSSDHIWTPLNILFFVPLLLDFALRFSPWRHQMQSSKFVLCIAILQSECLVKKYVHLDPELGNVGELSLQLLDTS